MTTAAPSPRPARRRWLRVLAFVSVFVVLGLGVLTAFVPAIASGMAPGIVRSAARERIAGDVTVGSASLSWGGPMKFGPIELFDPTGKSVAVVNAETTAGLWSLLRGSLDFGRVTVSGKADLVRYADGATNLEKATASRGPSTGGGGLPPGLAATVVVSSFDVTYRELDAAGTPVASSAIRALRGEAGLTTGAKASARVEMSGGVAGGVGAAGDAPASGSLAVRIVLDNFADAQGKLTPSAVKIDATIESQSVPVSLVDALAGQRGLLTEALGPTAAVSIVAAGDTTAGTARVRVSSPNVTADLDLALRDGKVVAEKPGSVALRSAAFLAKVPGLTERLAEAGVVIAQWPALEARVNAMTLPVPGAEARAGAPADLRGVALDVEAKTTYFGGTIRTGADAARPTQSFGVQPATVTIRSTDLAGGVTITAGAAALVDKQSAGTLAADVTLGELLEEQGRLALAGGLPRRVSGRFSATGVAASLLAPFVPAGVPVEVGEDLGPTLDVVAEVRSAEGAAGTAAAMDADVRVTSRNVRVSAPVRVASGVLESRGEITVEMAAAGALARRVAESLGTADSPGPRIGGAGEVSILVTDLRMPIAPEAGGKERPGLSAIAATARARVRGLEVAPGGSARGGAVTLQELTAEARVASGQPADVRMQGAMSHEGRPFTVEGRVSVAGLEAALAPAAPTNAMIPGVGPVRATGSITLADVPMSLANLASPAPASPSRLPDGRPGAANAASPDPSASIRELASGLVGDRATLAVTLEPTAAGQGFAVRVAGPGLSASVDGQVTATEMRLAAASADATVRPETVRALLRAAGQDQGQLAGVATRGPARVALGVKPVAIPWVAGKALAPDWARAGTASVEVSVAEPLIVTGIPSGEKTLTGGVRDLRASAEVPLAMLASPRPAGEPVRATVRGMLLLDEGRAVGALQATAQLPRDLSALDASATVSGLDTAAVDGVLGEPGLVSGALGATADISVALRQELSAAGDQPRPIRATVQVSKSPRLTTDPLEVVIDAERMGLRSPAKIAWTLDPAWADRFLLAPGPGQAQAYRLGGPTAVSVEVRALSLGRRETRGGLVVKDYLRPGVFAVDLTASASRVQVQPMDKGSASGAPVLMENVVALVKTGAGGGGALTIDLRAGTVTGGGVASREPVVLNATVRELATGGGGFNREGYSADIDLRAPSVPTALVDAVAGMNGRLVDLLGPQVRASLEAKNFSPREGTSGSLALDVRSFRPPAAEPSALVTLAAPVRDGLVMTGQGAGATPLRAELVEFNVGERDRLVQTLGIIATMSKQRTDAQGRPNPAVIQSANLRIPLDPNRGNLRRVSGDIDVSLGTVNYTMRSGFAGLIQSGMLKDFVTRDVKQPPMKPFRVTIRDGVATYQNVEIPLKVGLGLGEEIILIPISGSVNLVDQTIDSVVDLPISIVSGPVLSIFPIGFTDLRKKILDVIGNKDATSADQEEARRAGGIRIPIRIRGPLDSPKYEPSLDLFGSRNAGARPEDMIRNIGDAIKGIGDLFKRNR